MPGPVPKMAKKAKKRRLIAEALLLEAMTAQVCTPVETNANEHKHTSLTRGHSDRLRGGEADAMQVSPRDSVVPCVSKERLSTNPQSAENVSNNGEAYSSRVGLLNGASMQAELKDELAGGLGSKKRKRKRGEGFKKAKRTLEVQGQKEEAENSAQEARVWQYVCRKFGEPVIEEQQRKITASSFEDGQGTAAGRFGTSTRKGRFGFKRRRDVDDPVTKGVTSITKAKVNLTSITKVNVNRNVVIVTLTRDSRAVQEWVEKQEGSIFGLDLEWRPNFRKGQEENKVSLLQISTETECLLVQMLLLDRIPPALTALLQDPNRKFAGVGIKGDAKKLQKDHGLVIAGEIELCPLAVAHFKNNKLNHAGLNHAGLKTLAKRVLGFDMDKKKSVTMSNWSATNLSRSQVEYACIDAWVSLAIFKGLGEVSALAAA